MGCSHRRDMYALPLRCGFARGPDFSSGILLAYLQQLCNNNEANRIIKPLALFFLLDYKMKDIELVIAC